MIKFFSVLNVGKLLIEVHNFNTKFSIKRWYYYCVRCGILLQMRKHIELTRRSPSYTCKYNKERGVLLSYDERAKKMASVFAISGINSIPFCLHR